MNKMFPLYDASELSDDLGRDADKRSEEQLRKDLERASRRARRAIGGNGILTERLFQEREKQTEWELTFPGVEKVIRLVLDDEEISSNKYEVSKGILTVTDSGVAKKLKERNNYVLRIEYIPELLKDLELNYAELRIVRNSNVTTNDENSRGRMNDIKEDIQDMEDTINRLACSMADPKKGDHAKNIDRNNVLL